jgi:MFS family permease
MQQNYPARSAIIGWIFFDWATQPFFTLITTFVFAPYFATHVAPDPASGQALWGFATAAAGLIIALMSPVLGSIADASGRPQTVDRGLRRYAGGWLLPDVVWQARRPERNSTCCSPMASRPSASNSPPYSTMP